MAYRFDNSNKETLKPQINSTQSSFQFKLHFVWLKTAHNSSEHNDKIKGDLRDKREKNPYQNTLR